MEKERFERYYDAVEFSIIRSWTDHSTIPENYRQQEATTAENGQTNVIIGYCAT
jgi:hypothetical protein